MTAGVLLILDNAVVAQAPYLRLEAANLIQANVPPTVADDENAAPLYLQAGAAIAADKEFNAAESPINEQGDVLREEVATFLARHVDGGRKRRRGDRVAAVQNGGAQPCSSLRGDDRGDSPDHTLFQREAQECTATWRFGARYDVRC